MVQGIQETKAAMMAMKDSITNAQFAKMNALRETRSMQEQLVSSPDRVRRELNSQESQLSAETAEVKALEAKVCSPSDCYAAVFNTPSRSRL